MLQVAMWLVVRWDLVQVKEQTILMVSVASGFPTLLLYALQRTCLCQWVLHVVCDVWATSGGCGYYLLELVVCCVSRTRCL